MGLISVVKGCWNSIGYVGRVGALTGALLLGGFAGNLFAGEDADAVKLKDLGKYTKIKEEEAERKKKEKGKAEERAFNEGLEEEGADDFFDAGRRSSKKLKLLSRLEYMAETSDVVSSKIDNHAFLTLEAIGFKNQYYKLDLKFLNEQDKNGGFEFGFNLEGYKPITEKDLRVTFFLDSMGFGTQGWSGLLGIAFESKSFDVFVRGGGRNRRDDLSIRYSGPFPHHGETRYETMDAPTFSLGTRIGNEWGGEIKGNITKYSLSTEADDLPYLVSPPTLCNIREEKDGFYTYALGSIFFEPEGENLFVKFMATYYNYQVDIDGGQYETDGTPIFEEEKKYWYEEYTLDLYGFADFSDGDRDDDVIGSFDVMHMWDKFRRQLGVLLALGCRSNDNPLTKHLIRRNKSMFRILEMRAEKGVQNAAYNGKKQFQYDIGLGFWLEDPHKEHEWWLDRKLYLVVEANMMQSTDIGNLGINVEGWIDTATGKHPGKLRVQTSLYGKFNVGIIYELEFDDIAKLSATDGARHMLALGFGLGF